MPDRFYEKGSDSNNPIENNKKSLFKVSYQITGITEVNDSEIHDELIAVISAAVTAYLAESTHRIVVRSIRQVPVVSPVWNRAARYELSSTAL
ncbi:MAG TPA: hypothetical protein GXZ29_09920 [Clostridiales bacterium]|jgi:hypothetical protein|nr:hypothetical protein [Clostridiales bacterium]